MPELPEVETVMRGLQLRLEGLFGQRPYFGEGPAVGLVLFLEHAPQILELALGRLGLLAGGLLRAALCRSALLVAQGGERAGAGCCDSLEGLLRKTLFQREFLLASGAGDPRVGCQQQRIGHHGSKV